MNEVRLSLGIFARHSLRRSCDATSFVGDMEVSCCPWDLCDMALCKMFVVLGDNISMIAYRWRSVGIRELL